MKIEMQNPEFQPITFTIESKEELIAVYETFRCAEDLEISDDEVKLIQDMEKKLKVFVKQC